MYKSRYKKGSYGGKQLVLNRQSKTLADQQAKRYAKVMAGRDGSAPVANRGFGSMNLRLNREKKFFDIASAAYSVNSTGVFTLLFCPTLGSDFYNRIGRKTIAKSVYIRGSVALRAAAGFINSPVPCSMLRFIVFIDNQPNGAAPAVTDLLNTANASSQLNPNNRDRFLVIKDKQYTFDNWWASDQFLAFNHTISPLKCYKKLNLETIFNQTNGGTIGDINSGALYMFWIGTNPAGDGEGLANISTRVRFDDQ